MAYTEKDRKHMFWTQCMAMIAEYMAQQGIDYTKSDATTDLFWDRVTVLYTSGIRRGIFNLPLDIPKNIVLMGTEKPEGKSKEPETKPETQAKPEQKQADKVENKPSPTVKTSSEAHNKPEQDKKVIVRVCTVCKDNVSETVYQWHMKRSGVCLCLSCMKKKKEGKDYLPKSDPAAGKVTEEELVEEEKVDCVM